MESSFIGYLGDADFHDGSIRSVEHHEGTVVVRVRGASGRNFVVTFARVHAFRANQPEGMVLYSLSEMSCDPPYRRFTFVNWDEECHSRLEIDCETIAMIEVD